MPSIYSRLNIENSKLNRWGIYAANERRRCRLFIDRPDSDSFFFLEGKEKFRVRQLRLSLPWRRAIPSSFRPAIETFILHDWERGYTHLFLISLLFFFVPVCVPDFSCLFSSSFNANGLDDAASCLCLSLCIGCHQPEVTFII